MAMLDASYSKPCSISMAISMLYGYALCPWPYFMLEVILHAPWPYPCSIPMAILHGLRFICSSILYAQIHTLWNMLHEISFIYRSIFYTFTYHEICSMPIAISMPHENWKLKNEKWKIAWNLLRPRATETGSATAKTSIAYNSLNFGQINKISRL